MRLFVDRPTHLMRLMDAEAQASHLVYERLNPVAAGRNVPTTRASLAARLPRVWWACYETLMPGEPALRTATYQDVLDAPEHLVAELIDGELWTHPRPAGPHAEAASVLGMDLGGPFHRGRGGPGGWIMLDEPELHLGQHVLVPDLGGWRRERLPSVPDAPYFELAPDWVCEVLSPSTALLDRRRKLPLYAEHRAMHVWLVDPRVRSVEVLRLDGDGYRFIVARGDRDLARLEPFDAIELDLNAMWPNAPAGEQ